ncbi:MAG TPA: protein-glutamate O-methyltransferase CheR [Steroidobacteraceae bacterium]
MSERAASMFRISDSEFSQFQRFIYEAAGITLGSAKKALVSGRLAKRLHACKVNSYSEYFRVLKGGNAAELQIAIDLLTTNETYFFREPNHFQFLKQQIASDAFRTSSLRVWSAAGSTGEEAYSIAMLLEDSLPGQPWEVVASDISTRVLERARAGHYSMDRIDNFPPGYLQRFCLKGRDEQAGTMLIQRALRGKVRFLQVNLNAALPHLGMFDVVFLRNVLIYFNNETKRKVVARVLSVLKPDGYLFIGHSESLIDVSEAVDLVAPAIYRKAS